MRVAVVGAGIAGLSAAWELSRRQDVSVTVLDPGQVGGKIRTSEFAGRPVDEGPDAFLVRTPEAEQLCREVGVEDLVAPAAGRTLLWTGGRLRQLPEGLVLGVPGRLGPLVRSGLLSPLAMARAALDLVLPPTRPSGDVSVGSLVSSRFGRQVSVRLVEPLLGGIHAASLDELSAELTAPQLLAAVRSHRSLLLGLRSQAAAAGAPRGPIFLTPAGGVGRLTSALESRLRAGGVAFRPESVRQVEAGNGPASVATDAGRQDYDGVVLAVPAPVAAGLLGPLAPSGLAGIRFTSVAVVTMAIPASRWTPPEGYNGLLVPHDEGRLMTACSFYSYKWPGAGKAGPHIVRVSAGRSADRRVDEMDDTTLVAELVREMGLVAGRPVQPNETRLSRWPSAFPLYDVGHAAAVGRAEGELAARTNRIALAGSSYRGAGIPACIRSGRAAAVSVLDAAQG